MLVVSSSYLSRLQLRVEIICNHVTICKLLIRRKFLNSRSRPGFFNDGFQVSAKYPVCKERLTILVMAGRSESKHEDARFVLSRCNHMTNSLSQAWHWKWENTISPDSDSRLGSDVDSKNAVQLTHIVCKK